MKRYNNLLVQQIFNILHPLVGEIMAQGLIKSQFEKVGKNEDTIAVNDMDLIAETIRKGLVLFIGIDAAKQIADKIAALK